ncbi:MAG: MTAP family purine nucleoside phosphorylase [Phycisphaerales bacterium]|nr:MTAP family purine nucleoside phosphorylase [Phycisphaerales bacterium]
MSATLACIGGTSAYDLLREGALLASRVGPMQTPFGESQPIYLCASRFGEFYFLSRHGENGYEVSPSFVNYRANVFALKSLGIRTVVSWSEARAVSHNYKIGQYVLVDDIIDETRCRSHTFFENHGLSSVRQWPMFCPSIRAALSTTLHEEDCRFADRGVYVCVEGPRQETPAEARKYRQSGGELIGQTLAPEVFLARELQMCYASICYVARYAESGFDFRPFENGRILEPRLEAERAAAAVERLPRILERLCDVLSRTECVCTCERAMEQFILSGQLGRDWRMWFEDSPSRNTSDSYLP